MVEMIEVQLPTTTWEVIEERRMEAPEVWSLPSSFPFGHLTVMHHRVVKPPVGAAIPGWDELCQEYHNETIPPNIVHMDEWAGTLEDGTVVYGRQVTYYHEYFERVDTNPSLYMFADDENSLVD